MGGDEWFKFPGKVALLELVKRATFPFARVSMETIPIIEDNDGAPFRERTLQSKLSLYSLLAGIKRAGKTIYGISAPSRASTLINYVGLDDGILPCVLEIAGSKKIGKYMPGRSIPVLEETKLYEDQPAYALLLSWHIAEELMRNLRKRGFHGDFIVPLPEPRIIRGDSVI